ncbi:MAG: hypothetical protein EBR23_14200, partial [Planctomycetia bacterium]|nr:hypothetical protein [Planctomycetia bacterium]
MPCPVPRGRIAARAPGLTPHRAPLGTRLMRPTAPHDHAPVRKPGKPSRPRRSTAVVDDPIRLYLLQMGGIPLLNRELEVSHSRQIEHWRRLFRRTMLANDFILAGAVQMLEKVQAGTLRLDRTIEVSVTNTAEKKRLLKRLGPNLVTLRRIELEKRRLFRIAMSHSFAGSIPSSLFTAHAWAAKASLSSNKSTSAAF